MKAQGGGSIVTMGWDQAETGMEGDSGELFAATKGAIMAFTRSLALSLAPEVRVNALAPGWIKTAWGESASAAWQDRVLRETPLARWGTPEDVARVARFLVGPDAGVPDRPDRPRQRRRRPLSGSDRRRARRSSGCLEPSGTRRPASSSSPAAWPSSPCGRCSTTSPRAPGSRPRSPSCRSRWPP